MAERWKLSRAGITNVYQYADEVLHFGGGRLLLRGVNGSGKSTAMNMLLPFLLDADVRRIDAAGDQAGVLRSWMLAGRDETQPTGYLWLEVARGEDHLTFGCGIKANRNTSNVTHWWFVTERRPGIDLHLLRHHGASARTPLSAEELRQELGPGHVWTMDQRSAYRATLHGRLYGGADIEQHIRLLHIVRNPRVGDRVDDRIDLGLTAHLHDALPQLSEAAIDDAATPLEQLDEHRGNVSDLTATVATLDALLATYRDHVRSELRERVDAAVRHVTKHRALERAAATAIAEEAQAKAAAVELEAAAGRLQAEEERLGREIAQLEASEIYASATDLVLRRETVARMADESRNAARTADQQAERADADRLDVPRQEQAAGTEASHLRDDLTALAGVVGEAAIPAQVPTPPEVDVAPLTVGADVVMVPATAFTIGWIDVASGEVRSAAQVRSDEVAQAVAALDRVDAALATLEKADDTLTSVQGQLDRANAAAALASTGLTTAAEQWRSDATTWVASHEAHAAESGVSVGRPIDLAAADVVGDHGQLHEALVDAVEALLDGHRTARAQAESRLQSVEAAREEAQQEVDELAGRDVPDPPAAPWQTSWAGPCLAEVVDFTDSASAADRAGLEAALEASGLLMAEVRPDGDLDVGDLVVRPGGRVVRPLSRFLTVSVPSGHLGIDVTAVAAVLDGISTDPAGLEHESTTTITTAGKFRVGSLRGHHTKVEAEHVGVLARRRALERMRAAAATRLAEAVRAAEQVERDLALARARVERATTLRTEVPSTAPLVRAGAEVRAAERRSIEAEQERERAQEARDEADQRHGQAVDDARRICATAGLPRDRPGLEVVSRACRRVPSATDTVRRSANQLADAVARWTRAGDRWEHSRTAADEALVRAAAKADEHTLAARELATLEDAIGLDVQEVVATVERTMGELKATRTELQRIRVEVGPAGQRLGSCAATATRTGDEVIRSEAASVDALGRLRAAIAVSGVWPAAIRPPTDDEGAPPDAATATLPVVASSTGGLRTLAAAVGDRVPAPEQVVTHDGVRNALLQRRTALGAGWDAVSHHPELDLPLAVEVTGPLGQMPLAAAADTAARQLASKRGLLTAQQTDALRNLLQGLVAKEVAEKLHTARELVDRMNERLRGVRTTHGIGTSLRWKRRDDLSEDLSTMVDLLSSPPDLRTPDDDARLLAALSTRIADARSADPEADYRALIARVLDYREWHQMRVVVHRAGEADTVLSRRTPLSEGEKKIVSYQPLFAAVAASCDALAETAPDAPRFVLLDDAFAKVSEDNHPKLFGLLVHLDLDFIATSERLWGTHATVPELAITEVVRDADAGVIVLEHSHWDGQARTETP